MNAYSITHSQEMQNTHTSVVVYRADNSKGTALTDDAEHAYSPMKCAASDLFRFHFRGFGGFPHIFDSAVNRRIPKVESFFLYYQRSLHHPLIDGEDVLAQESDEEDLD